MKLSYNDKLTVRRRVKVSVVRWLHALSVCESIGAGPLRCSGIVRGGAHRESIGVMEMHG